MNSNLAIPNNLINKPLNIQAYCEICYKNPGAHSFSLVNNSPNNLVFYTKISAANHYTDTVGILNHYRQLLLLVNPVSWTWVFDCAGLELKHCFELKTAVGICEIIRDDRRLKEIQIINANVFYSIILACIKPFLNNSITSKIKIIKDA